MNIPNPPRILIVVLLLSLHSLKANAVELLVKWRGGSDRSTIEKANAEIGGVVIRKFEALGWQLVRVSPELTGKEAVQKYSDCPFVLAVELNSPVRPMLPSPAPKDVAPLDAARALSSSFSGTPNDPRFDQQWYLAKIGVTNAWAATTGSSNIVVAVIDTGINYNHEDLAANMWRNPGETGLDANGKDKATNGVDDDGNGYVDDVYGIDLVDGADPFDMGVDNGQGSLIYHGTACAGVIGAIGNNGKGGAGINWSIQLMAIRWIDQQNIGYTSDVLAAFDYIIGMKRRGVNIRVTNNSYITVPETLYSQALKDAIGSAGAEGILNVFAAGNNGFDLNKTALYPAAYNSPSIICVANTDSSDQLRASSNFGTGIVDLAAPGVGLMTTGSQNGYYADFSGTSAAAPVVAGAAALLLSAHPDFTIDQVKAALFASVDPLPALKGKVTTNGRLNLGRAISEASSSSPANIVIDCSPIGRRVGVYEPIRVTFSRPMNRATVENAFRISPAISGTFNWSDDTRSVSFNHDEAFDTSTNYLVRILAAASDQSGQTLNGNFNRINESSPTDDFVWTFNFPLPNDDFVNAQALAGETGTVTSNNRYATVEENEPFHVLGQLDAVFNSVWFRWTPPPTGDWFTFDLTIGTAFDSLLSIYSGSKLEDLVEVGGNDNYGTKTSSRVSFKALPDQTLFIAVAGKSAFDATKSGPFTLKWYATPAPGFTGTQFSPSTGMPGAKVTLTGTNFTGATGVLFNGVTASFTNASGNNFDLRITAIVPPDATSGPITIFTPHGNVTSAAIFQVNRPLIMVQQISVSELSLSWSDATYTLEASPDLRSWSAFSAAGSTTATINPSETQLFFRLSKP